ncbi:MAG TPA: biotin--[acetyl-CoA-carboxylase] ligase, partial [Planctomycetota bacterium]|nr:biotin--[acetyl-CoA-carboxylase] ligase [Planctomycetota bacterium]
MNRGNVAKEPTAESARAMAETLRGRLKTDRVGRVLQVVPSVESTNDLARAAVAAAPDPSAVDGHAFLALHQTQGRGRQGRTWTAPPGTSFLGSVILFPGPRPVAAVTATAALAVVDVVTSLVPTPVTIKWPNDVLVEGRKVAGILIEARAAAGGAPIFVAGIGVNVNQSLLDFPRELRSSASSILYARGYPVDLAEFCATLLEALERRYMSLRAREDQALAEAFLDRLGLRNRPVKMEAGGKLLRGSLDGFSFGEGIRLTGPKGTQTVPC